MVGSIRVLLVGTAGDLGAVTSSSLERSDDRLSVTTASRADDALDRADRTDCVVSAGDLPEMDAIAFLDAVRAVDADLPFIVQTGRGDERAVCEAIDAGVTDYVLEDPLGDHVERLAHRIVHAVRAEGPRGGGRGETAITDLHGVAADLANCRRRQAVYDRTVEAARTILAFEWAALALEREGTLDLVARSDSLPEDIPQELSVNIGIVGKTYREGRTHLVDDVRDQTEGRPQWEPIRASISVPIGDYGVLQVSDDEPGVFDAHDRDLVEMLVLHTESALDRIERHRELQGQNERLEHFARIVSHDLKNPLTLAAGRLALAAEECDSDHLTAIGEAHDRMEALIDDLLTYAQSGRAAIDTRSVSLESVVRRCWVDLDGGEADLKVTTDIDVRADPKRLRQVIENLLTNAIDHVGDAVTVTVGSTEDGFFVDDDGPGLDPDVVDEVFEPGYSTEPDGTGFGLSIVADIATAHGWSVSVDETHDGARFVFDGVDIVD